MKKYLKRGIILLVVIVILAAAVAYIMPRKTSKGEFRTTGIIEATEVNLAPKISERIKEVKFHEGDYIKAGETAVTLDDRKENAQFEQAQADLEVAKANVLNADANIEKAKVRIEDTKRDLGRYSKLLDKKLVAQNDVDKAQTAYDTAVADLNGALAQKALSEASVKQSEAALKVAKTNLDDTVVYSTLSGTVTLRAFEPGEMSSNGATILTVVDLSDIWVRADVEETAVSKIKLGDIAAVKIDSLPGQEFKGRVSEINSEGEFATQRDVKRGRQDIKTYRVKVKIDEPKGVLKEGMTATAVFTTR
jgi:multidrug resistance efflux pump